MRRSRASLINFGENKFEPTLRTFSPFASVSLFALSYRSITVSLAQTHISFMIPQISYQWTIKKKRGIYKKLCQIDSSAFLNFLLLPLLLYCCMHVYYNYNLWWREIKLIELGAWGQQAKKMSKWLEGIQSNKADLRLLRAVGALYLRVCRGSWNWLEL